MIRALGWIIAGVLLGGVVHLLTVIFLPQAATRDAYSRLSALAEVNQVTLLPQPSPDGSPLPFLDPAFATAICRYDLSGGPLRIQLLVSQSYLSASFYSRAGLAYYSVNDRTTGRRTLDLDLMNSQQRSTVEDDQEGTADNRLVVESPTDTGLVILRALAVAPGTLPIARGLLTASQCRPMPTEAAAAR